MATRTVKLPTDTSATALAAGNPRAVTGDNSDMPLTHEALLLLIAADRNAEKGGDAARETAKATGKALFLAIGRYGATHPDYSGEAYFVDRFGSNDKAEGYPTAGTKKVRVAEANLCINAAKAAPERFNEGLYDACKSKPVFFKACRRIVAGTAPAGQAELASMARSDNDTTNGDRISQALDGLALVTNEDGEADAIAEALELLQLTFEAWQNAGKMQTRAQLRARERGTQRTSKVTARQAIAAAKARQAQATTQQ